MLLPIYSESMYFFFLRLTTDEILSKLEEDGHFEGGKCVLHIPEQEKNALTDEDSDTSDEENAGNLNHLGRILLTTLCDFIPHNNESEEEADEISDETAPCTPASSTCNLIQTQKTGLKEVNKSSTCMQTLKKRKGNSNTSQETKKKKTHELQWCESIPIFDINSARPNIPPLPSCVLDVKDQLDLLKQFFTETFIDHIVSQSNLYAQQKNYQLNLTHNEVWVMFGSFLLSGYAKYPNKRMYWSRQSDSPKILSDAIRCNRFEDILHYLHFSDNSKLDGSDRLYKLRPLLDHLSDRYNELNVLEEHLSVDESMIPYYGGHFAKQFIKGKPIRFGYKNWALCSSSGYMYCFDVYMGKDNDKEKTSLGIGGMTVLDLLTRTNIPSNAGYKVYFDNYFTSFDLLMHLTSIGICATGTIRENRTKNCPLPRKEDFNKLERGSVKTLASDKCVAIRYKDNSVLTVASNFESSEIGTAQRWSREKKARVQIPQPLAVKNYNSFMGGVDLLDQFVSCYRTRMRQRKWWWPIFLYFFLCNSCQCMAAVEKG